MKNSNSFFDNVENRSLDIKELLNKAAQEGVGLIVGKNEEAAWTAELLAAEISNLDSKAVSLDTRSVQRWFERNGHGIGHENIVRIARVFAAGDLDEARIWRVELFAAQKRLEAKRRQSRATIDTSIDLENIRSQRRSLAILTENLFSASSALNLPAISWAGFLILYFAAFCIGSHSITYRPNAEIVKQVGLFWSLSWAIESLLLYPVIFITVTRSVSYWKHVRHTLLFVTRPKPDHLPDWKAHVSSFSLAFQAIVVVCVVVVFGLQWGGVYLKGLIEGGESILVDWVFIANLHPELVSRPEAAIVSMFAFAYTGIIYWLYFGGIVLIYSVVADFTRLLSDHSDNIQF